MLRCVDGAPLYVPAAPALGRKVSPLQRLASVLSGSTGHYVKAYAAGDGGVRHPSSRQAWICLHYLHRDWPLAGG
jgi:hypothetical protein